jgi:hypothetical protein
MNKHLSHDLTLNRTLRAVKKGAPADCADHRVTSLSHFLAAQVDSQLWTGVELVARRQDFVSAAVVQLRNLSLRSLSILFGTSCAVLGNNPVVIHRRCWSKLVLVLKKLDYGLRFH